jgi:Ca2+-binding RTX toxin-like protein
MGDLLSILGFGSGVMEMAIITGTNGNDQIEENTNASTVLALAGADVVVITGDDNVIDGGPGADDLTAIGDRNRLLGRTGSDTLTAEGEDNRLDGGANEDSLGASGNRSTLVGGLNLGRVEGSATPCGLRDVVTLQSALDFATIFTVVGVIWKIPV